MSSSETMAWFGLFGPFVIAGLVVLAARYPVAFNKVLHILKVLFAGRGGLASQGPSNKPDLQETH